MLAALAKAAVSGLSASFLYFRIMLAITAVSFALNARNARPAHLAVAAAQARARWVAAAVALTEKPEAPAPQDVAQLTTLRSAYEELTEAYEAMRRMVERGYLPYRAKP